MSKTKRQHKAVFYSPGTFFNEESERPIESWDKAKAVKMARDVVERYGARPYAFRFVTVIVADPIDDGEGGTLNVLPRTVDQSGLHFLGGKVLSFDDLKRRNDPKENILRSNMEGNGWWFVVENTNSWKSVQPFDIEDVVVDPNTGEVIERGDEAKRVAYRALKTEERKAEMEQWRTKR